MKFSSAARCLKAIARHYFEGVFAQSGAIRRKQDATISLRQFEREEEQLLKIVFDVKCLAAPRARKRRRIENDRVEFLSLAGEPRKNREHVVRDELVVVARQTVKRKIFPPSRQRFLGKIDIYRLRSDRSRRHRKGARIGKTIQQPLWRDLAHVASVLPLIDK